ncbi:putative alpha/beta hydrolase family esterase [Paraburkholderia sp. JPY465]|uniref:RBBP9/YdeN family alpha/beta hydrolase n=1 Tax=Paraburkholderia sp. JPY465 TaxID=3042285 RepID=UPI003D1BE1EF
MKNEHEFRVLILPGRGDSGADHWQTHWENKHPAYRRVIQREWDNPRREDWVARLDAAIRDDPRPALLVAHSLSVSLVVHWAARHAGPVAGALLVAPSDVESDTYPPGTTGFAPLPTSPLPFPSIVVASTDDPRVTLPRAGAFADAWGSKFVVAGAYGHLGSASRLGDWPFGEQLLSDLAATAARTPA